MSIWKVLGWVFIPYVMVFISWKKIKGAGKSFGVIWASIAALMVVANIVSGGSDQPTLAPVAQTGVVATKTPTPIPSAKTDPETDVPITTDEPVVTESPIKKAKQRQGYDVILKFPADKYPETAAHISSAIKDGESAYCTIDRNGADENRDESLAGIETKDGFDRDEWPMAMCAEGGAGANVEYISPSDNRGAGSWVGNQLEEYKDGTRILFVIDGGSNKTTTKPADTAKPTAVPTKKSTPITPEPTKEPVAEEENVYYANCAAVRSAGADPIYEGDPGYSFKLDRDRDGVACEK